MAFIKKDAKTHKHIVLSFKDGLGFGFAKNKVCRIVVQFQKQALSSQPLPLTSAPDFHCNFTWRVENNLLKRLHHGREQIVIEFKVQEHKGERPLGFAIIGLNLANFQSERESEPYLCLELTGVKLPSHAYAQPQVWVSLTIQSNLRVKATEPCYSAEVEDENAVDSTPKLISPASTSVFQDSALARKQISNKVTNTKSTIQTPHKIRPPLGPLPEDNGSDNTEGKLHEIGEDNGCRRQKYKQKLATNIKSSIKTLCQIKPLLGPLPEYTESDNTKGKPHEVGEAIGCIPKSYKHKSALEKKSYSSSAKSAGRSTDQKEKTKKKPALDSASEKGGAPSVHHQRKTAVHDRDQPVAKVSSARIKPHYSGQTISDISQKKLQSVELSNIRSALSSDKESLHIYKLEIRVVNVVWTRPLDNMKVCIRFVNPAINNSVCVENKDLYVPNLELFDIICHMHYLSLSSHLFYTLSHSLPRILIYQESNQKLIAKATIPVDNFIQESQDQTFRAMAHLMTKDKEVIGIMNILLNCIDMGVSKPTEVTDLLKSIIEFKDTITIPLSICNDFEHLFEINENLKYLYARMIANEEIEDEADEYENQTQKQVLTDSSKYEQSSKKNGNMEEVRNYLNKAGYIKSGKRHSIIAAYTKPQVMDVTKDPSLGTMSNSSETIVFCNFCQEYHRIKKMFGYITAIEAIIDSEANEPSPHSLIDPDNNNDPQYKKTTKEDVKPITKPKLMPKTQTPNKEQTTKAVKPYFMIGTCRCQGCSKKVEVGYDLNIWKVNELIFWCKECNDKHQQQSKESTENIDRLTDYTKSVENEYTKYKANAVSKYEYERLATAQHNLTMLFIHAREENLKLHAECQQLSANLEQLLEKYQQQSTIQDQMFPSIPPSVSALLREIRDFQLRHEKQEKESYEKQIELTQKSQTQKREDPAAATSLRRRERCKACQILHTTKSAPVKTTRFEQSPYSIKSFKTKLVSSGTLPKTVYKNGSKPKSHSSSRVSALGRMCVHDIRDKLDDVHSKISRCLEERDELVRTQGYTCQHPLISKITDNINKLFKEWGELKDELNRRP